MLLGLAGLLRPEAWGFAIAYTLWKRDPRLIPYAVAAPVIWMVHDLLLTGNPLHSLTGTQDNAETLKRVTGLDEVPVTVPRRLGEILREPGLPGAAAGGLLVLAFMRRRAALPIAAGLREHRRVLRARRRGPADPRPLPAAARRAARGVRRRGRVRLARAPGRPRVRGRWAAIGAAVLVVALVFAPSQAHRIEHLRASMHTQQAILADLHRISDEITCEPVAVPNHRPVPHVALWTGIPPAQILSAQLEQPTSGSYIDPANRRVERNFTLDPSDPKRLTARVPPGFTATARNASWVLYTRCEKER